MPDEHEKSKFNSIEEIRETAYSILTEKFGENRANFFYGIGAGSLTGASYRRNRKALKSRAEQIKSDLAGPALLTRGDGLQGLEQVLIRMERQAWRMTIPQHTSDALPDSHRANLYR